jgi:transposase
MPPRLSYALLQTIQLRYSLGYTAHKMHVTTGVSVSHCHTLLARFRKTGSVHSIEPPKKRGPKAIITRSMLEDIHNILLHRPCVYLEEIQFFLLDYHQFWCHVSTIYRAIKEKIRFTRKAVQRTAKQRNHPLRHLFWQRMGNYEGNQLVFADETAVNERTMLRRFGYAPKGNQQWFLLSYDARSGGAFYLLTHLTAFSIIP